MRSRLAWRTMCAVLALGMLFGVFGPNVASAPPDASTVPAGAQQDVGVAQLDPGVFNTLRVHGRDNEGAGNPEALDLLSGVLPEDAPYTDLNSVIDPQGDEAPRKDFITWNPIWMHEQFTPDENQHLYQQIYHSGINGSEKVRFRLWYEPRHLDKDIDADGVISERVDIVYPALMQEFTYELTSVDYDPNARYGRLPRPAVGIAGQTQFVFPMAMRAGDLFRPDGSVDTTSGNARYGYGLTSFDATFDGEPNIVQVHSENSLANLMGLGALWLDFDGDEVRDALDTDGTPLSGDELAILSLNPMRLNVGQSVQFLDYLVTLQGVGDADAVLLVRYVGDRVPDDPAHSHTMPQGAVQFIDRHGGVTPINGGDGLVQTPVSPFFVQLITVDTRNNAAVVRVGRGLGASFTAMESAPYTSDTLPGDPWFLKRFYVDGHEYNVVAIGTTSNAGPSEGFRFITIRTPVPKVPVYIAQHSVELQDYYFEDWVSVMPPYNMEHFIFTDIQKLTKFSDESDPPDTGTMPEDVEPTIDYVGKLVGPVAPILQRNGPFPYYGINPNVPYGDPREMFLFYVREEANPQFLGELKERYGEILNQGGTTPITEFWYVNQWWTQPWLFTELVLPDIWPERTGETNPDLYLLTSSWTADQTELLDWVQDGVGDPPPPWRYNLIWDPILETWVRDETVNDYGEWTPRVQFWFDPHEGGKKYKDNTGIRLYGRENEGPGYRDALDPLNSAYPVEVLPYSDPWAPFNPDLPEAPPKDSLTFNPVYMSRDNSFSDPLRSLYGQIAIEGSDAREKVFMRMWYEPQYYDKIRIANRDVYSFPAVMQEFTYMFLDTNDRPYHGRPGASNLVFPMATGADQLPQPDPTTQQLPPARLPSFGYGITSFDANFDGTPDIVRVHSEYSLNQFLGTVELDFNGNGNPNPGGDYLDPDMAAAGPAGQPAMTGDEMVVFSAQNITLKIGSSAQFLDYMVTLHNVASTPLGVAQAQLQLWFTGGGLISVPGGFSLQPLAVPAPGSYTNLVAGQAAVAGGLGRAHVYTVSTDNLGRTDGAWFVYVHSVNRTLQEATVTIGRALGGTYSAIDNGAAAHDLLPGDPWYLKRFFVDGHEYNVAAIRAEYYAGAAANEDPTEFKYITIRTPVPKVQFRNLQDSQVLEGYFRGRVLGVDTDVISVMPPFNFTRTIAEDVVTLEPNKFAIPYWYDQDCCGIYRPSRVVPPLTIRITAEAREPQFFGEIKQLWWEDEYWFTTQFNTLPDAYTEFQLPPGELYLLTSNWRSDESLAHFYGCPVPPLDPTTPDNPSVTWNQQDEIAALRSDTPLAIPYTNMPNFVGSFWPPVPQPPAFPTQEFLAPYYDGLFDLDNSWENSLRVKFWYNPQDPDDIYINRFTLSPSVRTFNLHQGWNLISFDVFPFNPAIASVLSGINGMYDRVLAFDCNAGTPGLSYYPSLPALSSLQHMDPYHGYWIHMTMNGTLTVRGMEIPDTTPLYLCEGWNLVSYLPDSPLPVTQALANIDGLYSVVLGWDNGALSYYPDLPPALNSLHQLEPGRGYWIKMTKAATLGYPDGFVTVAEMRPNDTPSQAPIGSRLWADFYASAAWFNGSLIPKGSTIRAYDPDGVLCGEKVMPLDGPDGQFLISVYGDDPETPTDEGARPGDVIRLTVTIDGVAYEESVFTWPKDLVWVGDRAPRTDFTIPFRSLKPVTIKTDGTED